MSSVGRGGDARPGGGSSAAGALARRLEAEQRRPVPAAVERFADLLADRAGSAVLAVLYYGSTLRTGALDGVIDFYLLTDRPIAWPGAGFAGWAGRVLPPNVGYVEAPIDGATLRAKVAVMPLDRFARSMAATSLDTTLWARFSQPFACVRARDGAARAAVAAAAGEAVVAAGSWAARLGPARGGAADFWRALFARTYAAELRVESGRRPADLIAGSEARYAALLPMAWAAAGIGFDRDDTALAPRLSDADRSAAARAWRRRERLGRPLNALRLLKAATTFDRAIDYVAWKIERHSGVRIVPTPFQRRHPLLAAPILWWRLRRRGLFR